MSLRFSFLSPVLTAWFRRSAANLVAVSERQQVESLRRDEKTQKDALASIEDKLQLAERQANDSRVDRYSERQTEVGPSK